MTWQDEFRKAAHILAFGEALPEGHEVHFSFSGRYESGCSCCIGDTGIPEMIVYTRRKTELFGSERYREYEDHQIDTFFRTLLEQ